MTPSSSQTPSALSQVLEFAFSPFFPRVDNNISEVEEREEERKGLGVGEKRIKIEARERKKEKDHL